MTRTPHPPDRPATPDDAELGSLVRSIADDWHMNVATVAGFAADRSSCGKNSSRATKITDVWTRP